MADLSVSLKDNAENTRRTRAVGNVVIASFGRDNNLSPRCHKTTQKQQATGSGSGERLIVSLSSDNDLAPPRHRPIVCK